MKAFLIPLFISLQFLTRLPVSFLLRSNESHTDIYTPDNMARTLKYYPVVGLIIGATLVSLVLLLQTFAPSHTLYMAGLVGVLWILITGGLHLDGVADMADAWVGGLGDKEKTLRIMKDPVCGPFGVLAIVLVILLKVIFIYELLSFNFYLIFLPPLLARIWVIVLLMTTPYVREQGMGSNLVSSVQKLKNIFSILIFSTLAFVFLSLLLNISIAVLLVLISGLFGFFYRMQIMQRLGGITGDVAGAFIEYMELMILFGMITLLMM